MIMLFFWNCYLVWRCWFNAVLPMTGFLCLLGFKVCCGFVGVGEMISEAGIYTTTTFLLWWAVVMMMVVVVVVDKK
jgi:hypothetical protein